MWIWNFVHNNFPLHVYELLAIVLLALMAVVAIVQSVKQKRLKKKYEEGAKAPSGRNRKEAEEI